MTHIEFTCSDEKAAALLRASRLYDEGVKPAEWISVKDGMPEDFIDHSKDVRQIKVLVAIKAKNGWTVRTQMRCKDVHSRFYGASPDIIWYWRHFSAGDITHWMSLPETPKDSSDASDT